MTGDASGSPSPSGGTPPAAAAAPLVELSDVRKSYRSGEVTQVVLDGLSLSVAPGELLVLLGPSGSGKTTLLNLIGGLDVPDSGRVHSCGVDLGDASTTRLTRYRARSVGFVFQFYNLLPTLTALENVVAGVTVSEVPRAEAEQRAREVLARVGLADATEKFPAQLSGGEQQRVALARALAKRPALLVADEPTGNLDRENAAHVLDLLVDLGRESRTTFVVVTHDPEVAAVGTRLVHLMDGRIAEGD